LLDGATANGGTMKVEWDARKAEANRRKHGISFREAATVFSDPLSVDIGDPHIDAGREPRHVTVGISDAGRTLVVVYTDDGSVIRLISARRATKRERHDYET
jgi:uncharacterized protein